MPPAQKKGHTTLSDLLAEDVRDYLVREGVPENPEPEQQQNKRRSSAGKNRRSRSSDNATNNGRKQRHIVAASTPKSTSSSENSSSAGSLRAGWASTPSSTSCSAKSSPSYSSTKLGISRHMDTVREKVFQQRLGGSNDKQQQSYQQQQQQHPVARDQGQQFRGQHTAESGLDANGNGSKSPTFNPFNNKISQQHKRHSSGSGSFQSIQSLGSKSKGSTSSRSKHVSAADNEFLRRYAEEKERTNLRMTAARPNSGLSGIAESRVPNDAVPSTAAGGNGALSNKNAMYRPYHSITQSPRPPTVTGSHRPGLPSIDNDDWEEDDRIERHDKRKMERKEQRRLERRRSRTSSEGGDSASVTPSINTAPSFGTRGSVVYHNPNSREDVPRPLYSEYSRMTSQGSVVSSGSVGVTPGSERYESGSTLCYSTGSSNALPPELPYHNRADSMGSFIRRSSLGGLQHEQQQEIYPQQQTTSNGQHHIRGNSQLSEKKKKSRHVRPLSYLSASSDSGKESEEPLSLGEKPDDQPSSSNGTGLSYSRQFTGDSSSPGSSLFGLKDLRSSPHSSSSGTTFQRHPLQPPDLARFSSTDGSDLGSALLGSAIIEGSPSGESSRLGPTKSPNGGVGDYRQYQHQYQQRRFDEDDEDSSDGSYDSEDESSSTSDSYYGDSSSNSHTSSEHQRSRPGRPHYQQNNNDARWEPVKFNTNANSSFAWRDIEGGQQQPNEREGLTRYGRNNGGPNYSSTETKLHRNASYANNNTNRKNKRYNKTPSGKHRLGGPGCVPLRLDDAIEVLLEKIQRMLVMIELYISNMPSLVGSLALAWCSLGVDWFKWYEETFDACHPTHYHNKACVFTEFPGCFACETHRDGYQFFVHFHYLCSTVAFILSSFLVGKIMIAFPVVRDELANPTTAAPLGLLCMAFEKIFAGNFGYVGMGITFVASALHASVACWFIFISVVYKTLPEPSWFSNTTGIGLAAAKIYLYWTGGGYFLSVFSVVAFAMFYVVSLYRIHTNEKISAPVCWVQLSGPAVVLYGFTIFSQPGSDNDDFALLVQEHRDHFFQVHRKFYMPVLHLLFAFCLISMVSSIYLVKRRWRVFRDKEFSPAHVSFGAPLVSHANAMQAYRSSLEKFCPPSGTTFKLWLYRYWSLSLICGTVAVLGLTWKFFVHLPGWCQIDVEDDEMPPEPQETIVTSLLQKGQAGDEMRQNFVSAAVLQANESGALVRVLQDGKMKYVRSRRMPSMGFDPIMNVSELMSERDRLLQHVTYAANPDMPRMSSFDDTLMETFNEPDRLRASSGRHRLNFMSFDASTMMRG